jgi:glutamyl-tRNA synthetase
LRAALTGRTTSPGLFYVMAVLGRTECLTRLEAQSAETDGAAQASMNPA